MPWIQTVEQAAADGVLREAYDWQAASLGEVTEFTQLGSLYPDLVMERLRLYKVVEGAPSQLSALERRVAAYVTSMLNGTRHCASGLEHRFADMGTSPALVEAAAQHPAMTESDIDRLRQAGLSDLDILDLNNIVAYYNYINRVANGLGLTTEIPAEHARRALPR